MQIHIRKYLVFIILNFCFYGVIIAQFEPAPVEISSQKVLFQGKIYYMHTIKPNQTLYSIGRAYNISTQEIINTNPDVQLDPLKPGQVLRIPEAAIQTTATKPAITTTPTQAANFIYHTVAAQETVYSISRKYQVSVETIYEYNPESKESLSIGQHIKIPSGNYPVKTDNYQPADSGQFYMVKEGDTLYNIAGKYNTTVANFIESNPDLRYGLKAGMILNIPGKTQYRSFEDSVRLANTPRIKLYNAWQSDSIKKRASINQLKIVVLLPLHASEIMVYDTISNDSLKKNNPVARIKSQTSGFLEFYEGMLLAIDSLKRDGKNITLFTFDTRSDTNRLKSLLPEISVIKPDMIIGPFRPQEIRLINEYSEQNKIPLILPLSRTSANSFKDNPYAVYMIPSLETELSISAGFLSQFQNKNTIVIYNSDSLRTSGAQQLRNSLLKKYELNPAFDRKHYTELLINDTLQRSIAKSLTKDMDNLVVLISNNEATVGNIISLLSVYAERNKIVLFGLPTWQKFDNLRIEQLHRLNTIVYSPFYIDYSKPVTKNFITNSRKMLKTEPFRTVSNGSGINLTFLGYETGLMFGVAFFNYGPEFINCLTALKFEMPESDYTFKYSNSNGFSNNSINFIQYTDSYAVKRILYNTELLQANK